MSIEHIRVSTFGLDLNVMRFAGDPQRTAIILHGYLDQASSFIPVAKRLAEHNRQVILLDFRGHGDSSWIGNGGYYYFPDYVLDVTAVLEATVPTINDHGVSVIGHSMGGTVATMFSGTMPDRVKSLCLLEGLGPPAMPASVVPDRTNNWIAGLKRGRNQKQFTSIHQAMERLRLTHGPSLSDTVIEEKAKELTKPHPSGTGLTWKFDPLHQTTSPSRFDLDVFSEFASRITAPVLLVDAGESGFTLPDHTERALLFKRTKQITMPNAGHMMHWTAPDDLAQHIHTFLSEHNR